MPTGHYTNPSSSDLQRVNSHVYVSPPSDPTPDGVPASQSPAVVVFFGWFNARLTHEKKYGDVLKSMYPSSTLVLVKVDASWLWSSQSAREALLEPVADILDNAREDGSSSPSRGVLLHVMSNGGGMQLMTLSKVLAKRPGSSRRPPGLGPVALVLDSLPDGDGLRCMIVIYTSQTKNPIAKYAAVPLLAFLYSLFYLSYGNPPVLQEVRQRLNTPNLLPGFSASDASTGTDATPRLYVYSDADKMTRIAEVDSHVEEARRRGFDVRTEMFDKTAHVSHAKGDPERYWNAVAEIWRKARTRYEPKLFAKL